VRVRRHSSDPVDFVLLNLKRRDRIYPFGLADDVRAGSGLNTSGSGHVFLLRSWHFCGPGCFSGKIRLRFSGTK
jgi:hypothetical protein